MKRTRRQKRRRKRTEGGLGPAELEKMRVAGTFAAELLDEVGRMLRPGISTADIDRFVAERSDSRGARSATLGYQGYPAHCCTSINEVVCHGIPSDEVVLADGDIINVDVTPIVDGYYGDTSRTFAVGSISAAAQQLIDVTREAMWRGIATVAPGQSMSAIGAAIQGYVEPLGFSVVREFTGHGIGRHFHGPPTVFHHVTLSKGVEMVPGMVFTIEPMINAGHWKTKLLGDGWTAVTVDGKLSAQFEHTVAVTESGVDVLTLAAGEEPRLGGSDA